MNYFAATTSDINLISKQTNWKLVFHISNCLRDSDRQHCSYHTSPIAWNPVCVGVYGCVCVCVSLLQCWTSASINVLGA